MFAAGLVEETRGLLERYGPVKALDSLGYRQALAVLAGTLTMRSRDRSRPAGPSQLRQAAVDLVPSASRRCIGLRALATSRRRCARRLNGLSATLHKMLVAPNTVQYNEVKTNTLPFIAITWKIKENKKGMTPWGGTLQLKDFCQKPVFFLPFLFLSLLTLTEYAHVGDNSMQNFRNGIRVLRFVIPISKNPDLRRPAHSVDAKRP